MSLETKAPDPQLPKAPSEMVGAPPGDSHGSKPHATDQKPAGDPGASPEAKFKEFYNKLEPRVQAQFDTQLAN